MNPLALLLLVPLLAGPRPGSTPRPEFPMQPSKAVGVLLLPGAHPWGTYYEPGFDWSWAGTQEEHTYRFLVGETVLYAPYFAPVEPVVTPFRLYVELPAERTTYVVDAARGAKERAARAQGITRAVQLVEVEVNDGRGGHGTHFVITGTRLLEGTKEFPFTLEEKLAEARKAFDAVVERRTPALGDKLAGAADSVRRAAGERLVGPAPAEREEVVYRPVWNPETRTVDVLFAYRKTGGYVVKTVRSNRNTKGSPPPPQVTARYSAGMAVRYRLGKGAPTAIETFGPMVLEPSIPNHHVPWSEKLR